MAWGGSCRPHPPVGLFGDPPIRSLASGIGLPGAGRCWVPHGVHTISGNSCTGGLYLSCRDFWAFGHICCEEGEHHLDLSSRPLCRNRAHFRVIALACTWIGSRRTLFTQCWW